MESVDMLSDLRTNVTALFRRPNEHEVGVLAQSAQDRFLSWQFERLLNASADLLDRASEQRAILLGLLAHDLEQRLSLEASRLSAKHEAARVKLGEDAMRDPIAHAMIPIFKMATASRTYGKIAAFHFQQDEMLGALEKTDSAAQKFAATAQRRSLDAERQKFENQTILSEREWQAEREDFMRRVDAARLAQDHADQRAKAAANGGVLDYQREARVVGQRIVRDFNEAMSRLLAAHQGLVDILAMPPVQGIGAEDPILDAVVSTSETVRRLVEWHALRTQHDQGFTAVVSIREACDAGEWQDFLSGRMIDLHLGDAFFAPWVFPRLRGVSAEYVGQGTRSFRMQLAPPLHGRRSDGVRIDQTKVPPCYLGRVAPREERREPEQNGAVTLMNVCPVGDDTSSWRVQIDRFDGASFPGADMIDDVELRFSCVGIPRQFDGIF